MATKKAPEKTSEKKSATKKSAPKKWSKKVTEHSDVMNLEKKVFKQKDPKKIAESVKRSAEKSKRIKAGTFQYAMPMINFYENRDGKKYVLCTKKSIRSIRE